MAAAGRDGGSARASPSLDIEWMRRVLALPLSDAVVYVTCVALWAFMAGMMLLIAGRRAGGGAGDRVAAAGLSAVHVAIRTLLFAPLAVTLFAMRAAVSAFDSDSDEEPAARRRDSVARRRALWEFMMKDFKLVQYLFVYTALAGYWMERRALGSGSFQEKAGSALTDASVVIVAVIICFYVCPSWILEWRTSQKGSKNLKHYLHT